MFGTAKAERDAAFVEFMRAATPSLTRTAWLLTGSADAAHELVQASLVKTYAAWHRVRPEDATAYARRILVNHRTDTWRRSHGEVSMADLPEPPTANSASPVDDRDAIVRMLATLPRQQRAVIVLRYYHDLPERAVAEMLGISLGAVKSAASRGLATLRDLHATVEGGTR